MEAVTLNEKSQFEDVLSVMNGFDIMLAPSGSHMANLLFLLSPNKAVIEVGAVCMEANLNVNFKYILSPFYSTGHRLKSRGLESSVLQKFADGCNSLGDHCDTQQRQDNTTVRRLCPTQRKFEIFNSAIVVNINALESTVREAIAKVCSY